MAEPAVVPERTPLDQDDALCHQVCCQDHDLSLCGRDVAEASWKPPEKASFDCVVCDDLNEALVCPLFARCRP